MQRPGRKRLSADIPIKIHHDLKDWAKKLDVPLTKWIIRALVKQLIEEKSKHEKEDVHSLHDLVGKWDE